MLKLKIILLLIPLGLFGQTTRKAYPDTLRQSGNVLLNDFDPQGDPLKCVRFNGISILRDSIKITKKDTGTFILKKDGNKIGRLTTSVDEPACGQNVNEQFRTIELTYGKHMCVMVDKTEGRSDTFELDVKYPCQVVKVEKK